MVEASGAREGPFLAITLGDPRGIGPEVVEKALRTGVHREAGLGDADVLLVGPRDADPGLGSYEAVGSWDGSETDAGRIAGAALRRATELAVDGPVRAIVTGPVHKPALRAAGWSFPGQTEMLAHLAGREEVGMVMAAERTHRGAPLRVLLATTHLPLREVPRRLTADLLEGQTRLLRRALAVDWGIGTPRLALCALNPHASDGGLFGDEEERVYRPALERLRADGIDVEGPVPADTVFHRALAGEFDAVVAPYHDVGMAAFKTAAFGAGVNVTVGLPFVRTSPDHGTALDIAGRGVADPASTVEAIRTAVILAGNRSGIAPGDEL